MTKATNRQIVLKSRPLGEPTEGNFELVETPIPVPADGQALCPMAIGLSHHINPWGDIEPCPVLQFAAENIRDGDLAPLITDSQFLDETRRRAAQATRGCILLEQPAAVASLAAACHARDTSHRQPGMLHELHAMTPCPSHAIHGAAIPERHWAYRFAKKRWFFGFGAYG